MKDLKQLIIKIVISAVILILAFIYLEKKPPVNAIHFDISKPSDTPATPSQLKWHDSFKGIENLPSKPKISPKENN
jgi:hypothetical protein